MLKKKILLFIEDKTKINCCVKKLRLKYLKQVHISYKLLNKQTHGFEIVDIRPVVFNVRFEPWPLYPLLSSVSFTLYCINSLSNSFYYQFREQQFSLDARNWTNTHTTAAILKLREIKIHTRRSTFVPNTLILNFVKISQGVRP